MASDFTAEKLGEIIQKKIGWSLPYNPQLIIDALDDAGFTIIPMQGEIKTEILWQDKPAIPCTKEVRVRVQIPQSVAQAIHVIGDMEAQDRDLLEQYLPRKLARDCMALYEETLTERIRNALGRK